jgi:hypothetical protein
MITALAQANIQHGPIAKRTHQLAITHEVNKRYDRKPKLEAQYDLTEYEHISYPLLAHSISLSVQV